MSPIPTEERADDYLNNMLEKKDDPEHFLETSNIEEIFKNVSSHYKSYRDGHVVCEKSSVQHLTLNSNIIHYDKKN